MGLKGWKLTTKGQNLYSKINAGQAPLSLTKMGLGDGTPIGSDIDNLAHKLVDIPVSYSIVEKNITIVEGVLDTSTLTSSLSVSEWGVYAIDPDIGEILLAVNLYTEPYIIQPNSIPPEKIMRMVLVTSVIENDLFASKEDLVNIQTQINELKNSGNVSEIRYSQITKLNVEAPKEISIPVLTLDKFCYPPIEIFKLDEDNSETTYTVCEFSNGDKEDFIENNEVIFDGTMYLRTNREIPMSTPVEFGEGYVSSTEEIDLSETSPYQYLEGSTEEEVMIR